MSACGYVCRINLISRQWIYPSAKLNTGDAPVTVTKTREGNVTLKGSATPSVDIGGTLSRSLEWTVSQEMRTETEGTNDFALHLKESANKRGVFNSVAFAVILQLDKTSSEAKVVFSLSGKKSSVLRRGMVGCVDSQASAIMSDSILSTPTTRSYPVNGNEHGSVSVIA